MRRAIPALLLLALSPATLRAQRPLHLGVAGGLSMPQGTLGTVYDMGLNVRGFLELDLPVLPIGIRGGLEYESFGGKSFESFAENDLSLLGITVDAVLDVGSMPMSPTQPYILAGAGRYDETKDRPAGVFPDWSNTGTVSGWHVGIGTRFRLGRLDGFLEARYRSLATDGVKMIPLSLGLRF